MTPRDVRLCLHDVRLAGDRIRELTDQLEFSTYEADWVIRSAAERQFEVIGEALNRALRIEPALEERIRDARHIIAFRNRVAHGYDTISNAVVWGVIHEHLPRLLADVNQFVLELGGSE